MRFTRQLPIIFFLFGFFIFSFGQDTINQKKPSTLLEKKVTQKVLSALQLPSPDTVVTIKSEEAYLPYEGKIIRHIIIDQIGFDRTIQDTSRWIKTVVAKTANKLHNDTKSWVIKDNLFIREGKPLNPYRLADNERYLRDLEFILDSRIFVLPISEESDSVDLLVMTRDVFSLGAAFYPQSSTAYRFRIQEANLGGMGQRVLAGAVYDLDRSPKTGYEFNYQKLNLFGSFINFSTGYTQIDNGRSEGEENEFAYFFKLSRPLFNPFTRWTGGLEWSRNWSQNVFDKEQSAFANYQYNINDLWAGYAFGLKKLSPSGRENRNRTFFAVRAFDQYFTKMPDVPIDNSNGTIYGNRTTFLGQASLFKQNFYKTRFIYGFGRTEDVPYGYRISLTGGWERERGYERPYMGAEAVINSVTNNGTFLTYTMKLGNYLRDDLVEDALAQFSVSRYSRVYFMGKSKIRHYAEVGFASLINQTLKKGLDINDENGVYGFKPDSLYGTKRFRFRNETVIYTPWSLLGFHLAPLTSIDLAFLGEEYEPLFKQKYFYSGFSAGLRARNENLIFRTVEARLYYYPKVTDTLNHLLAEFKINLRIKYPTTLVTTPATVFDP